MLNLNFAKSNPNAIIPSKREADCGYDIYGIIEDVVTLSPNEIKFIPTGLHSAFDTNYQCVIKERGSTGSKGLSVRCGVIEGNYRGEWFIALNNTSSKTVVLYHSDIDLEDTNMVTHYNTKKKAIAQALFFEKPVFTVTEITLDDLNAIESDRGNGKLGSSGK